MALTPEELKRLGTLVQNKKEVNFSEFSPNESSTLGRVKSVIEKRGADVESIVSDNTKSPIRRGFEATASAFRAVPEVAVATIPSETVRSGIDKATELAGTGIGKLADVIGDSKKLQEFTQSHPEATKALEEILSTTSAAGEISGNILATKGVSSATDAAIKKVASKIPDAPSIPNFSQKVTDFISRDPDVKTATILSEAPKGQFDKYIKIGREASVDPRKLTPYEVVGDEMANAAKVLKTKLTEVGKAKSEYIKPLRAGLDNFGSKNLVDELVILKNRTPDSGKAYLQKIIEDARKVKTKGGADKFIDELQDKLFSDAQQKLIAEGSTLEKQLKGIVSRYNDELKASLPKEYANLNARYSNINKALKSMNRALGEVVEGVPVRGSSLIKQFFSPSGRKAKELFEYIKKNTGIDLAQETTLARFAMEVFDDPRARALLEGVPTSARGVIDKVVDFAVEKTGVGGKAQQALREAQIRRARKLTK